MVAARREEPLEELVAQIKGMGAQALAVPTDVRDEGAVQTLARLATATFGRIDVWVNNAAVTVFGRFEETPPEAYRQVIETNLFGYIHGARAALPIFREQGSGMLVNVASMVSKVAQPYVSSYVASKQAVRGLGMSLRQELTLEGANIHVCTVMPATIDTPFFHHAGNYTGRAVKAMPPVYPAENVSRTIVKLVKKPRHEVFVGNAARMINGQYLMAPKLTERMMAVMTDKQQLHTDKPAEPTPGNVFTPMPQHTGVSGGWKGEAPAPSRGRQAAALGLAVALPALALWWFGPGRGARRRHDAHDARRAETIFAVGGSPRPRAVAGGAEKPRLTNENPTTEHLAKNT
jgi:short-subunit dehydrogenase